MLARLWWQKNTAWCRFLGFFLAAGSLTLQLRGSATITEQDGAGPNERLVVLQPSLASGANALEELVRILGVLGWMATPSSPPSPSDALPSFALSRPPSSPVASASGSCVLWTACPALHDYLLPMVTTAPAPSLSSPSPITPNAPSRHARDHTPLPTTIATSTAEIPSAAAHSQANDWNAVTPAPVASDSAFTPLSPHRCLYHSWRFLLSTAQARAVISGWLLAQGALPALEHTQAEQQLSSELPPDESPASPVAAVGATWSVALRDDLVLLGALAGWQASVEARPTAYAQSAWSVSFQTSSAGDTACQTASFEWQKPRVVPASEHQQTHVYCLTVETQNFLVRRLEACKCVQPCAHAASRPVFTHNCIEHQLGSVGEQQHMAHRTSHHRARSGKDWGG